MKMSRLIQIVGFFSLVFASLSHAATTNSSWSDLPRSARDKIRAAIARDNRAANSAQLAELTPSIRQNQDWFGISIAISGNTIVVGAFDSNIEQFGSAYVFVKPASGWANMTQTAKLTSSDNGQGFGNSVAISGNTVVIGAANPSNFSNQAAGPGAAYVFVKPANGWADATENAKLTASDGVDGDAFGNSVAISGNTIAVGAIFANDSSGDSFAGKAYVFTKPSSGWSGNLNQTAELTATDSGLLTYMGCSVAVSGDNVVTGSYGQNNFQGSAYVFTEPSGGWANMTQTAELTAANGQASDFFGFSVSISGNTVVAGAPSGANTYGAAYIYVEPENGWQTTSTFTAEIAAPDAVQGDGFGQAIAIGDGGAAIAVGAPSANVGSNSGQGAAYAYVKPMTGWKSTRRAYAEAFASDGAAFDGMGVSIALDGKNVVTGAVKSGAPGEAYVFGP
jgi:hypothetical protein